MPEVIGALRRPSTALELPSEDSEIYSWAWPESATSAVASGGTDPCPAVSSKRMVPGSSLGKIGDDPTAAMLRLKIVSKHILSREQLIVHCVDWFTQMLHQSHGGRGCRAACASLPLFCRLTYTSIFRTVVDLPAWPQQNSNTSLVTLV